MKIAQQVNLFALRPAPTAESGEATIQQNNPTVEPLKTILPDGSHAAISPLMARIAWQQFSGAPWSGIAVTPSQTGLHLTEPVLRARDPRTYMQTEPTPAAAAAPAAEPGFKDRSKAAWSVWSGTTAVLHVTEGMSQAQISMMGTAIGLPQTQANGIADSMIRFLHSQGGEAITFGVTFGGIGGAIATMLGYRRHALAVGIATGIAAFLFFVFVLHHASPFAGKWTMNALETVYQVGTPPRQAIEEVTEDNQGLKIKRVAILENGKRENQNYHVHTDGAAYKPDLTGDSAVTTKQGDTLTSVYSKDGQAVARETISLSADHKRMTVTTSSRAANGEFTENVTVYDRQ